MLFSMSLPCRADVRALQTQICSASGDTGAGTGLVDSLAYVPALLDCLQGASVAIYGLGASALKEALNMI